LFEKTKINEIEVWVGPFKKRVKQDKKCKDLLTNKLLRKGVSN